MVLTTHSTSVWIKSKGGMTQQELSELTGTPQSHISEIENGRRQIGKKRAKILGNCSRVQRFTGLETVQKEGNRQVKRKMEFYNLDPIISVGLAHDILMTYLKKSGDYVPRKHQVGIKTALSHTPS